MEFPAPLVSMSGIDKIFFGSYANRGVDFDLAAGEIHALIGENGAGKTTLMNVLAGIYSPDAGRIFAGGREVRFKSPRDAIKSGIGMVHQHFMLAGALSVWENVVLGMDGLPFVLDKRGTTARIREMAERYAMPVDPEAPAWTLSIGEQQRVEILKTLYRGAKVLVLDEPTSVLTPRETRDFFAALRIMTAEGCGVVLISHKIEEVLSAATRITVLRKGEKIATVNAAGATRESLAEMMVGRVPRLITKSENPPGGHTVLSCRRLSSRDVYESRSISDMSFELHEGEILGVAGVAGNGQGELCELLCGLRVPAGGEIFLSGEPVAGLPPRGFIERGVSYIPVDRKGVGLVPNMSMTENMAIKYYWRPPAAAWKFFIDWRYLSRFAEELAETYGVQIVSPGAPISAMSGGNLQKLMLARELSGKPKVILAMHPVWGLDVGAAEFVRERLLAERARGAGIILVSEDLDELMEMSDRMMVMSKGRIMGVIKNPAAVSKEEIGLMMGGTKMEGAA